MRECKVFDVVDELSNGVEDLPVACLKSRPQSHPFSERRVPLGPEPTKVGRSVAKSKPAIDNAIFDCKVLSRNHALLWYESGQFWLKDTKSSNGTFVNNQRLGKGNEESPPRQLFSGDIVQFGVEVVENSKKVTHGCVMASVFLYHADGSEAKRPDSASMSSANALAVASTGGGADSADAVAAAAAAAAAAVADTVSQEQLHQLSQYLQEALHRERLLSAKLDKFRELLDSIGSVSSGAWTTVLDQEQLVQRLELLEAQLAAAGVSPDGDADDGAAAGDSLSAAVRAGAASEEAVKRRLETALIERSAALHQADDLERTWRDSCYECQHLRTARDRTVERLRALGDRLSEESAELSAQLAKELARNSALKSRIEELGEALSDGQRNQPQPAQSPQSARIHLSRVDAEAQTLPEAVVAARPATEDATRLTDLREQLQVYKTQLREQQAALDASSANVDNLHTQLESALTCLNQLETRMLELESEKQLRQQRLREQQQPPPPPPPFDSKGQQNVAWLLELLRCLRADPTAIEKAQRQLLQPLLQPRPPPPPPPPPEDCAEIARLRASLEAEADGRRRLLADCDSLATRIAEAEFAARAGREEHENLAQRCRDIQAAGQRDLANCRAEARAAVDRSRLLFVAGLLPAALAVLAAFCWIYW